MSLPRDLFNSRRTLVPAAGVRVVDPRTHEPLPPQGKAVVVDQYWVRMILDGAVSLETHKAPSGPETSPFGDED